MKDEIRQALASCKSSFASAAIFSFFINMLLFISPLYMLQIYDRVLPARSETTLLMLSILVGLLLITIGMLEWIRTQVLVRTGAKLDHMLNRRIFVALFSHPAGGGGALRDFDAIREFFVGTGFLAFLDAPWAPIFIGVCFVLHPWLGVLALGGSILLISLAVINEVTTRKMLGDATQENMAASSFVETSLRSSEALHAMGMMQGIAERWLTRRDRVMTLQSWASDRAGLMVSMTKVVRIALQSAILGLGAYLAIHHEITPGAMIAASIIMGRALAPVEMAVGQWKQFINARGAYGRLNRLLEAVPDRPEPMALPKPRGVLNIEAVMAAVPGSRTLILKGLSFSLEAGEALGVIGPSAAGKSTLARVLVGIWPVVSGKVRIDGSDIQNWSREQLGPHIGYLPQDVALFDGTVAENIARFGTLKPDAVVAAARLAGVHEIILKLQEGYDTRIGTGGISLSGGQRQRIGLARALYGEPALMVLDEPNSNLDTSGEHALLEALLRLREKGTTVVVITHRMNVLSGVNKILVLKDGLIDIIGPRDQVLAAVTRPTVVQPASPPQILSTGPT